MGEKNENPKIRQIPSGIHGLDEQIMGGFQCPSNVYLVGEPGAGKTTFATQFLCEGARRGEKGIYFSTLGEPAFFALSYMSKFDFYDSKVFEKKAFFRDLYDEITSDTGVEKAFDAILRIVEKEKPVRVVIDSLTPLGMKESDSWTYRAKLFELLARLKVHGCTTLLVGEAKKGGDDIEAYLADAVIYINSVLRNIEYLKYIRISKMRGVNHTKKIYEFQITKRGIEIFPYPAMESEHLD